MLKCGCSRGHLTPPRSCAPQAMERVLCNSLTWRKRGTNTMYALHAEDIQMPPPEQDAPDRGALEESGVSVERCDFRGRMVPETFATALAIMRDARTELPYQRRTTVYEGLPTMLEALQCWVGAEAHEVGLIPDAAGAPAPLTCHFASHFRVCLPLRHAWCACMPTERGGPRRAPDRGKLRLRADAASARLRGRR